MAVSDLGQAGAIEITPAMLEAGVIRLYDFMGFELCERVSDPNLEKVAVAVFCAMSAKASYPFSLATARDQ
jgi:hypothetical protein